MAELSELLKQLVESGGSDIHLKAGAPPFIRMNGRLQSTKLAELRPAQTEELASSLMSPERAREFTDTGETDFAIGVPGVGRFRASVLRQRGSVAIVLRRVLTAPPSFEMLGLPVAVGQLAERQAGLVLVTGPADSGKSTTVSSMIDHINTHEGGSVITIEDPIEILHVDKNAFINQREVGTDTATQATGLRRALRHDPDVIYVDRITEAEVMSSVMAAAKGRLVISTLPSRNAEETIARVIDFFPERYERQIRHELASVLQGIVSQRLINREDGKGRIAAFEVLVATPRISDSITEAPGCQTIDSLVSGGDYYGMQTMDQHLGQLAQNHQVSMRDALSAAIRPQELRARLE